MESPSSFYQGDELFFEMGWFPDFFLAIILDDGTSSPTTLLDSVLFVSFPSMVRLDSPPLLSSLLILLKLTASSPPIFFIFLLAGRLEFTRVYFSIEPFFLPSATFSFFVSFWGGSDFSFPFKV